MTDYNATALAKIRQAFQAVYSQHGRLLAVETPLGEEAFVVERMHGREAISECFEFVIDCTAPSAHFELKSLIGQPMTLRLAQASGSPRAWHGYITQAGFLGADGGLARYRLHLQPWLSFLSRRRNCLVFQDLDALEIIERIFADYPQADYAVDVSQTLAKRPRCTQYRETDLAFVERLLAEEGLSFHFRHDPNASAADTEHGASHGPQLRIFDCQADAPDVEPATIRFHRISAAETEDAITVFSARRALAPNTATLSAWDAFKLKAHAAQSEQAAPDLPGLELYDGSRSSWRHQDEAGITQSVDNALAAARLKSISASGTASARQLAAGCAFTLTDHASDDGRYVLCAVEHRAANNLGAHLAHLLGTTDIEFGSYRNAFVCVPDTTAVVPTFIAAPQAAGPESALVVGVADETLTSNRDHRVKIQFPWQRGEQPTPGGLRETHSSANPQGNAPGDERAGTWVRVAEGLAGPNWGDHFTPRIGSEVLVDFLDGDFDQPIITGQFYNGSDAPPFAAGANSNANHPGTLSGTHDRALDGSGHNQWVHDDAPGQLRTRLATTQADSALNLGYLIDQQGAYRGAYRGQGAELKTAGWAALRAPEGLLVSSSARSRATSTAQDVSEAVGQLKAAQERATSLSDAASAQSATGLNANSAQADFTQAIDPNADGVYSGPVGGHDHRKAASGKRSGGDPAERFAKPFVFVDSPSTVAFTTPASQLHYAGQNTHVTTQGETQHTAGATYSSVAGATTSLYTHDGGAQAVAANGPLSLQAHDDTLEILADDSVTVTSSSDTVNVFAQSKIVLTSGQSTVTLEGGNITFACPGTFTVKGGAHGFVGPASQPAQMQGLPTGNVSLQNVSFNTASGNPFVQPSDEDSEKNTHSECDLRRKRRDLARSQLNLQVSRYTATKLATGTGNAQDIESLGGVARDMANNYGKIGLAARAARWQSVAEFLMDKGIKEASGFNEAVNRFQEGQLNETHEAKKKFNDLESQVQICETNAQAKAAAAAEQAKIADAMDYLDARSALEDDISGIAMAAALTNTGAKLTHRDFEYRYSQLFPETDAQDYLETQHDYSNSPQWNTESLNAQRAHEHILSMARPVLDSPPADVSIPPPAARDKQLDKLRRTRDQMHALYDQQLKPIWRKVMDYWSEPPGGTT